MKNNLEVQVIEGVDMKQVAWKHGLNLCLSIIFYSIGLTYHSSPKEYFFFREVALHLPGLRC